MSALRFEENTDYILVSQKSVTNNPRNPYTIQTDHIMPLDMAKEIAMIQRSHKSISVNQKRVRTYLHLESTHKHLD